MVAARQSQRAIDAGWRADQLLALVVRQLFYQYGNKSLAARPEIASLQIHGNYEL
jgi:hypothetical protein